MHFVRAASRGSTDAYGGQEMVHFVRALGEGSCHSSETRKSHRACRAEQWRQFAWSVQVLCAPSRGKCTRIPKFPPAPVSDLQGCCSRGMLCEFSAANDACLQPALVDAGASQTCLH